MNFTEVEIGSTNFTSLALADLILLSSDKAHPEAESPTEREQLLHVLLR